MPYKLQPITPRALMPDSTNSQDTSSTITCRPQSPPLLVNEDALVHALQDVSIKADRDEDDSGIRVPFSFTFDYALLNAQATTRPVGEKVYKMPRKTKLEVELSKPKGPLLSFTKNELLSVEFNAKKYKRYLPTEGVKGGGSGVKNAVKEGVKEGMKNVLKTAKLTAEELEYRKKNENKHSDRKMHAAQVCANSGHREKRKTEHGIYNYGGCNAYYPLSSIVRNDNALNNNALNNPYDNTYDYPQAYPFDFFMHQQMMMQQTPHFYPYIPYPMASYHPACAPHNTNTTHNNNNNNTPPPPPLRHKKPPPEKKTYVELIDPLKAQARERVDLDAINQKLQEEYDDEEEARNAGNNNCCCCCRQRYAAPPAFFMPSMPVYGCDDVYMAAQRHRYRPLVVRKPARPVRQSLRQGAGSAQEGLEDKSEPTGALITLDKKLEPCDYKKKRIIGVRKKVEYDRSKPIIESIQGMPIPIRTED